MKALFIFLVSCGSPDGNQPAPTTATPTATPTATFGTQTELLSCK